MVGVGSVGTRCWIALMDAGDGTEPLFLQPKEAEASALAPYCGRSHYASHGERVVAGQLLMQAESDIFLGWTHVTGPDGVDHDYYVRQLKDWKFSFPIEQMIPSGMAVYAQMCGWSLARAHARSGDRIALAAYLGGSPQIRPGDRRLRRGLRRPERPRLRRVPGRRQRRPGPDHHRHLRRHTARKGERPMANVAGDMDAAHADSLRRRYLIRFEEDTLRQRPLWIRLIIEFLGTFVLVTVAAGAGVINHYVGGGPISRTAAVIAPGAVVMAMIYAWGPLSGLHINPAVTFGFASRGVFPARWVVPYWVVQFAGAICAALFLQVMFGDVAAGGNYPITTPGGEWKSLVMRGHRAGNDYTRLVGVYRRPGDRRRHRRHDHRTRARAARQGGARGRRGRRPAHPRPHSPAAVAGGAGAGWRGGMTSGSTQEAIAHGHVLTLPGSWWIASSIRSAGTQPSAELDRARLSEGPGQPFREPAGLADVGSRRAGPCPGE